MRGPQRDASRARAALARCEKVALVGVQARDLQFAFRWPRQRFDPNFSIQTWATGLVERGNIRR